MFVDDVTFRIKAGNGGNGNASFRHEHGVEKGGPFGGNGGRGGNIIFVGDGGLTTLLDLKYRHLIKAENGENGMTKNMFGHAGKDVYIKVPIGSVVYDNDKNIILADITRAGEEVIIAKGGKGGRGNTAFANAHVTAPMYAENGEPGEEINVRVVLKILADVGLVGFPSVGKSTIISVASACKPKIADYPFTTLVPNIGVVRVSNGSSFVMADMPGLIEGASLGAGLGIQFLKHIERTRVLIHVIDMAPVDGRDPYEDYIKINKELENYNPKLLLRPQIIAANKMDMEEAKANLDALKKKIKDVEIVPISAYTRYNIDTLMQKAANLLKNTDLSQFEENDIDKVVEYRYEKAPDPFTIERLEDGTYNVVGPEIKRLFDATNFEKDESVRMFARKLRLLGVDAKLRELGVKNDDTVLILGYEFEFYD